MISRPPPQGELSEGDPADLAVTLDIAAGERFDVD
jgi:hypothetical protein